MLKNLAIAVFSTVLVLSAVVSATGTSRIAISSDEAVHVCGADKQDRLCFTTPADYWCQGISGGTPCGTGCNTCVSCEQGDAFQIRRCQVSPGDTCHTVSNPPKNCGRQTNGLCNAGCMVGSYADCVNNGFTGGSCGMTVQTGCN